MSDEKPVYHFLKVAHPEAWDAERYLRDEIARLAERCDAYKGQVKAGDEQLARLTRERDKLQSRFDYIAEHLPNGWSHCTTEKELCEHAHFVESEIAALRRRAAQMETALQEIASAPVSECFGYMRCTDKYVHPHVVHVAKIALSPSPPAEAIPVSGAVMYCGACGQWLADGRKICWHPATNKYYCLGCSPSSPPKDKESGT
jgi:hypothetical protein